VRENPLEFSRKLMEAGIAKQIENQTGEATLTGKLQAVAEPRCPQRREGAEMLTAEQAVRLTSIPSQVVHRWLEDEQIQALKLAAGVHLLCLKSLRKTYADTLRETKQVRAMNRASLLSGGAEE
jgi:hypothetical protein